MKTKCSPRCPYCSLNLLLDFVPDEDLAGRRPLDAYAVLGGFIEAAESLTPESLGDFMKTYFDLEETCA